MKYVLLSVVSTAAFVTSCGTANVNKIFGSTDNSTSGLMERAQLAFDRGDFDTAEDFAKQAYDGSDNNGPAAVLLGNIMLGKAGIDVFQLVGKLSDLSKSTSSTSTTTTTTNATDTCATSTSSTDKTSAATNLSTMSCKLLSLSAADIAVLGTDTKLTSTLFAPVTSYYKPAQITDTVRNSVNALKYASEGITYLCPFINRTNVLDGSIDERHALATCGDKSGTNYPYINAHIAFALLHLVETLVYERGIAVDSISSASSSSTSSTGGIQSMASNLKGATISASNFTQFATAVTEMKTVVDTVFDVTNSKSQIALALDGLTVVAAAFGEAGLPAKVTSSITSSLTKLKETAKTISGSVSDSTKQSTALKGQISKTAASTVASKIDSVCTSNAASCAAQKTSLCAAYSSVSSGVSGVTAPTICQ